MLASYPFVPVMCPSAELESLELDCWPMENSQTCWCSMTVSQEGEYRVFGSAFVLVSKLHLD